MKAGWSEEVFESGLRLLMSGHQLLDNVAADLVSKAKLFLKLLQPRDSCPHFVAVKSSKVER